MATTSFGLLFFLSGLDNVVILLLGHVHHNHLLLLLNLLLGIDGNHHIVIELVHRSLLILVVHILHHLLRMHLNLLDNLGRHWVLLKHILVVCRVLLMLEHLLEHHLLLVFVEHLLLHVHLILLDQLILKLLLQALIVLNNESWILWHKLGELLIDDVLIFYVFISHVFATIGSLAIRFPTFLIAMLFTRFLITACNTPFDRDNTISLRANEILDNLILYII